MRPQAAHGLRLGLDETREQSNKKIEDTHQNEEVNACEDHMRRRNYPKNKIYSRGRLQVYIGLHM